jgi:ABC-type branched-subunit amino acid transport system ATPase component
MLLKEFMEKLRWDKWRWNNMLKIKKLSKHFGGIKAVNDCSFNIEKGKITALIGPNGSGKSTLFNLISGVLKADCGKIFLDDKEITNMSIDNISNIGISRIFQKSRLFNNLTITENILLAFDNEDEKFWKNFFGLNKNTIEKEKKIMEMLKLMNMHEPKDKSARHLSFGQKRLVEIVRAAIKPHKLLMLDEPVAGVAPILRKSLSESLLRLKEQGETIFIIEHDMDFILNIADDVIVMNEGKIIAQGNPAQIKKNKEVMKVYLGS